jgi:hypothetical protein
LRETLEELLSRVEEDKLPVEGWEENGQVSSCVQMILKPSDRLPL